MLFSDPLHDEFGTWILGFAPYGGGDVGEIESLARQVGEGGDDAFYDAFVAFAQRRVDEGEAAAERGRRVTARDCFLRAAATFGVGYHPLYGTPVDPRLADALHRQFDAFDRSLALLDAPGRSIDVPYEDTKLPARFVPAFGHATEVRPTILVGGGWDSTMVDNHLGFGIAALQRGYHVLLFDGPGQGSLLVDEGLPLRHDWERVVTPVVDAALGLQLVDEARVAYYSWSLGGYFAPRAAVSESRLAAAIADPGQIDVGGKFNGALKMMGLSDEATARLPHLDPADEAKVMAVIEHDRSLHWKIVQRGFWTNGATDLSSWIAEMSQWKLDPDQVAAIRCPMLVTAAESDMASSNAKELYDALRGPKAFLDYTAADGAGMHCEMLNRSMANRQMLDWLDETLATA